PSPPRRSSDLEGNASDQVIALAQLADAVTALRQETGDLGLLGPGELVRATALGAAVAVAAGPPRTHGFIEGDVADPEADRAARDAKLGNDLGIRPRLGAQLAGPF